jgi:hypothetical protein
MNLTALTILQYESPCKTMRTVVAIAPSDEAIETINQLKVGDEVTSLVMVSCDVGMHPMQFSSPCLLEVRGVLWADSPLKIATIILETK